MLRLRSLREEIGKTQSQMAEIFNISRQVYANYENEINQPSLQLLIAIADYFQCSVDYLLGRSDDFGNITIPLPYNQDQLVSSEEKKLFKHYRKLTENDKKTLLDFVCFLDERNKK